MSRHVGRVVNEKDRVHVKRRKVAVKLDDKPRILIYHKQAGGCQPGRSGTARHRV